MKIWRLVCSPLSKVLHGEALAMQFELSLRSITRTENQSGLTHNSVSWPPKLGSMHFMSYRKFTFLPLQEQQKSLISVFLRTIPCVVNASTQWVYICTTNTHTAYVILQVRCLLLCWLSDFLRFKYVFKTYSDIQILSPMNTEFCYSWVCP